MWQKAFLGMVKESKISIELRNYRWNRYAAPTCSAGEESPSPHPNLHWINIIYKHFWFCFFSVFVFCFEFF